MRRTTSPLIIEQHPIEYNGFPFITLIQYHKTPLLCIVDNASADAMRVFVLDLCGPAGVSEEMIVMAASDWYENFSSQLPISVYFSKNNLASSTNKIFRSLNTEFISRAIGPVPKYPTKSVKNPIRRRRKPIPSTITITCPC